MDVNRQAVQTSQIFLVRETDTIMVTNGFPLLCFEPKSRQEI